MKKRFAAIVCAAVLAVGCIVGITACSGSDNQKVAATVNGTKIYEDTITDYIQSFRDSYSMTDDDSWAEWMSTYGYTPETVREAVIDSYVQVEVIKAAAKENDVTVDSSTVDSYVDQMKAYYSTDEAWQSALSSAGLTEDSYREKIEESLLEQNLMDKVCPMSDPDNDTLLTYAKMYASYYDGAKRSSHILFDASDTEKAQQVLDQINAGTISFEDAAKQYSTDTGSASDGGDVGWDVLSSFVTEYTDALDGLSKDQVSGLVTSDYGIHIIKCTDVFTAPSEVTSTDQIPSELLDSIKESIAESNQQSDFSTWLEDYQNDKCEVVVNDMPSGLSYDVDMSAYENTNTNDNTNSDSNTNSNSNANSNENANTNSNTNSNSNAS